MASRYRSGETGCSRARRLSFGVARESGFLAALGMHKSFGDVKVPVGMTDLFTGASSELWCRKGERIPRCAWNDKSFGDVKVPVGMTDLFTGARLGCGVAQESGFLALLGMTRVLVAVIWWPLFDGR